MTGFMKISDAAKKWGIGERRINTLCIEGRIPGVVEFGTTWAIPVDAEKPKDARIKSGKYIKSKCNILHLQNALNEVQKSKMEESL
jgi:hypothetical protein